MMHTSALQQSPRKSKQFPDFLIDTILKDRPQSDVTAPMTSPSDVLLGDKGYASHSREQTLLVYAHRLAQWGSWMQEIQKVDENPPHSAAGGNIETGSDVKPASGHKGVWNPVFGESIKRMKEKDLQSHIGKLRKMSRYLEEPDEELSSGGHPGLETSGKDSPTDSSFSADDRKDEDQMQLLWPAWVYCTRYSNRPSAGPRARRRKRKSNIRPRTAFTTEQINELQKEFACSKYLNEERKARLSSNLGLTVAQIKVWFQNKRAKMKKNNTVNDFLATQLRAQGLYDHSVTSSQPAEVHMD